MGERALLCRPVLLIVFTGFPFFPTKRRNSNLMEVNEPLLTSAPPHTFQKRH